MGTGAEVAVDSTLRDALEFVGGMLPTSVTPAEVLAAHIFSLVKDLGLTESLHVDPLESERAELPAPVKRCVGTYLPVDDDVALRDRLYDVFVALADDRSTGVVMNRNRPLTKAQVLLLAQTAWNLERNDRRPLLPLGGLEPGQDGASESADIWDPRTRSDFARMTWTKRSNQKGVTGRTSGDSFRKQTARLAVLAARRLVEQAPHTPDLSAAQLEVVPGGSRIIRWPTPEVKRSAGPRVVSHRTQPAAQLLIGNFVELGDRYEHRRFDEEIERLWSAEGNRRVWLSGGPGLGKSYAARRIMQQALGGRGESGDALLIWVDAADAKSVSRELVRAAEQLQIAGPAAAPDAVDREYRLALEMLGWLRTTSTRWIVIYDDARADELIRLNLLPPGTNQHGRALITTLGGGDVDQAGRHVVAEYFSPEEAERYLRDRVPASTTGERVALAECVGHHPLVLSIATATIVAERMSVADWLSDFAATQLDVAADHSDPGGYPHPITATWRVALSKAARGFSPGVVERAAMVAAAQDPDGHPTWLWRQDAVRRWVDADDASPARPGRMHPAVSRLIDYGLLTLHGDGNTGRIAMHQMAARAVRESAVPEQLAALAKVLATEWLLQLTANPTLARPQDIEGGARTMRSLTGLDDWTTDALHALLAFTQPSTSPTAVRWMKEELDELEPLLLRCGVIGRAELAERYKNIGHAESELGRLVSARGNLSDALEMFARLCADDTLDDELRAEFLESAANLNDALGQLTEAQAYRQTAIKLRERVAANNGASRSVSNLFALTDLHHGASNLARSGEALDRAIALMSERPSSNADRDARDAERLAERLASHGRAQEAIAHLRRAASQYRKTRYGRIVGLKDVARELAKLYGTNGDWKRAERWMTRSEDNPLLLASIQLHRGKADLARENIARAALKYSDGLSDEDEERLPHPINDERGQFLVAELMHLALKAHRHKRWENAADIALVWLELAQTQANASPGENPENLAKAYKAAGLYARFAGRNADAASNFRSGIAIYEMLSQLHPDDERPKLSRGQALAWLAPVLGDLGEKNAAVATASQAVALLEDLESAESQKELASALDAMARAMNAADDTDGALAAWARVASIWRTAAAFLGADHSANEELADSLQALTAARIASERWNEALESGIELLGVRESAIESSRGDVAAQARVADACFLLGWIHQRLDQPLDSERFARKGVAARRDCVAKDPGGVAARAELAFSLVSHAQSLSTLDREKDALNAMSEAVEVLQLPAELDAKYAEIQIGLLREFSRVLEEDGRSTEADEYSARADRLEEMRPGD